MVPARPPLTPAIRLARALALALPALLLGGAYIGQYAFGLYPCEMCWWQRYAHFAAVALALIACVLRPVRVWTLLAALAILISGAIGGYHAGVEYNWWQGHTACTGVIPAGGDIMSAIAAAPIISCGQAQWRLLGVSLAGWNFLFSTLGGLIIVWLLTRRDRTMEARGL